VANSEGFARSVTRRFSTHRDPHAPPPCRRSRSRSAGCRARAGSPRACRRMRLEDTCRGPGRAPQWRRRR
jgi:hypothetical protein